MTAHKITENKSITAVEKNSEQTPAKKLSGWRRVLKISGIAIGSLLALVCLLLVSVYLFLRSSEFTQDTFSSFAPQLASAGVKIHRLDSLKFDPLKSVAFNGLSLEWQDEKTGEARFEAQEFKLQYSIWELMENRFQLDELILQNAQLSARFKPQGEDEPKTEEPEDAKPLDLEKLEQLLSTPPLDIDIKDIQLNAIDLDIALELPEQTLAYKGQLKKLAISALWTAQTLKNSIKLDMSETPETSLKIFVKDTTSKTPAVLQTQLIPSLVFDITTHVSNENRLWQLQTANLMNVINFRDIRLSKSSDAKTTPFGGIKKVSFELTTLVNSDNGLKTGKTVGNGFASLFPLTLKSKINSDTSDVNINDLQQNGMRLSAKAEHQFNLDVDGQIPSLERLQPLLNISLLNELSLPDLQVHLTRQKVDVKNFFSKLALNAKAPANPSEESPLLFNLDFNTDVKHIDFKQLAEKTNEQDSATEISAALQPKISVKANGGLTSLSEPLENLNVNFEPEVIISDIDVQMREAQSNKVYRIARQAIQGKGQFENSRLNYETDINVETLDAPEIEKPFSLFNHLKLSSDIELKDARVNFTSRMDEVANIDLALKMQNPEKQLSLAHEIKAQVSSAIADYLPAAVELEKLGELLVSIQGTSKIKHQQKAIQEADTSKLMDWPLSSKGDIQLTQLSKPVVEQSVLLSGPVDINYALDNNNAYQTTVALNVPGVLTPPLKLALPLNVQLKNAFTWPLSTTKAWGSVKFAKESVLDYQITVIDKPKKLTLKSEISAHANPDWQKYLIDLQALDQLGKVQTDLKLNSIVRHDKASILEFDQEKLDAVNVELGLHTLVKQTAEQRGSLLYINKPLTLNNQLKWNPETVQLDMDYQIADLVLPEQLALENIQGELSFSGHSGLAPNNAHIILSNPQGSLRLLAEEKVDDLELGAVLFPMTLETKLAQTETQMLLEQLDLALGGNLLQVSAKANTDTEIKNAQLESQVTINLHENFFPTMQMSGKGKMQIPLNLIMVDGEQMSVDGELQFDQFSITSPDFAVQNLHGKINLQEELLVTKEKVDFRYLIEHDPFQRVDFSRIQPYLDNPALRIESISAADMTVGPMLSMMQLKQNIFQMQHLDLALFGGHLAGQFYLDANPGGWKIGLLSRISQLDPRKMLKDEAPEKAGIYSPVSVRTAIDFDVHKRLLQGRVDVSEISREQLLQLLDVVDPKHEDEQLAHVRTALQIAYPKWVSIVMKQGLMDLSVAVSALPKPIEVKGLPLTPLIQVYAGDLLSELDKITAQQKADEQSVQDSPKE